MHDPSFLAGLKLGEFLTRIRTLEHGLASVKQDVHEIKTNLKRASILGALWTFGLIANLSTDAAAQFAVEALLSMLKR